MFHVWRYYRIGCEDVTDLTSQQPSPGNLGNIWHYLYSPHKRVPLVLKGSTKAPAKHPKSSLLRTRYYGRHALVGKKSQNLTVYLCSFKTLIDLPFGFLVSL